MWQAVSTTSNASSIPRAQQRPFSTGMRAPLVGSSSSVGVRTPLRPKSDHGIRRPTTRPSGRGGVGGSIPPSPGRQRRAETNAAEEAQASLVFDRMYDHLMREEAGFVGELERFLDLHEQVKRNKSKALYNSWEGEIFDGVQEQISAAVDERSARAVSNRGASLMQEYIDVHNKKTFGVFRDIVIEAEYDPMSAHEHTIKYRPRTNRDPCKLELRKHAMPRTDELPRPEYQRTTHGGPMPRMSCELWDKLESTPYGRLGKVVPPLDAPPYALHQRVIPDAFTAPPRDALARETPMGKRCFPQRPSIVPS